MRDEMNDLTKLIKLALIFGFLSMIGSAAMAASSKDNADALSAAAQRAQDEFTIANKDFQSGVRERIIVENNLKIDEPAKETTTGDTLLASAAK